MNLWQRLVRRLTRRKRWEQEVMDTLRVAVHAAGKLNVEMQRRSVDPKAEYDYLVASRARIYHLMKGAAHYDEPDTSHGQ